LDKKAALVEEGTPGGTTFADYGLARLNRALAGVLAAVESADTAPTAQAVEMFATLQKTLTARLSEWKALQPKP
jgi:hypothetical protein